MKWILLFLFALSSSAQNIGTLNATTANVGTVQPASGGGSPTYDTTTGPSDIAGGGSATLANVLVNSGHSGTYLHALVTSETLGSDITGITRNGQAFTKASGMTNNSEGWLQVWELKNPTVGTFDMVVAASGFRVIVTAISYYNINQTTPLGTAVTQTGNNTSWSQSISTAATDLVINYDMCGASTLSENGGQTSMGKLDGSWSYAGSYKAGTGGSVSMGASITSGARQFLQWSNVLKQ